MRTIRHTLLAACLFALPHLLGAQALPSPSAVHQAADSLARDFVTQGGSPSVAIGIVRGNDTIAMTAVGKADLENDIDATPHTVYRIGSVTKQFTAAAILQLVEQDKLALADSIAMYVKNLPNAWRGVTIRQLLNHTSGIPSYTGLGPTWQKVWGVEMVPDTVIALTFDKPMDFAPGTKWAYDNTGYVLLGMVIEKVTGHTWGADLQSRFVVPMGLTDTRECLSRPIIPRRASGYEKEDAGWSNTFYLAMSQPHAAGAMCSTVLDLARWNRALHTGKVVSPALYAMMTTPEGAAAEASLKYGFGLARVVLDSVPMITHGGGIHGFITANTWVPSAELSVTVLTNSGSARADELMQQLVRAALGKPLRQVVSLRAVELAAADAARYPGTYLLEGAGKAVFTVALADKGITGQLTGQPMSPLVYLGNHTFGVPWDQTVRIVFAVEGDHATGFALTQRGQTVKATRQ